MPTTAYAGLPPWKKSSGHATRSDQQAGWQWQAGVGTKKTSRGNTQYVTGGWSHFNKDEYDQRVKKDGLYQFRLYNGKKTWVPGSDVDNHIASMQTMSNDEVAAEVSRYIESAWEKESGRGRYYEFDVQGPSHITRVRYNPTLQVMEVTFGGTNSGGYATRADTVTFLRVPVEIMLTMEHFSHGERGLGVDGKSRSMIGIKFWDLVRIRGTRQDVRYMSVGGSAGSAASMSVAGSELPASGADNMQQYTDAMREATETHNEEPVQDKYEKDQEETFAKKMASTNYTEKQKENIMDTRDMIIDKYGVKSRQYQEFSVAVSQGMGAIIQIRARYQLWNKSE